ncbi:uncharacterized protein LOC129766548 [Toxorhynchites rutilus septentrionalis]|uniref:uncharacterized protein LOC129766548 n=1 Tax=Toxorhynchites rutilus septentrionalis TaxID=329112 RepID=UPI00247AEA7A|nr:uncharacterized protein LOC129766548 [Toxorhynchites rutilus septentrionalis]
MAQSVLTYDEASTRLMKWYESRRMEEELDYVLTARCVIITRDMNLARRRKFLRDRLKAEGEGNNEISMFLPADPTNDLTECSSLCTNLITMVDLEQDEEKQHVLHHRLVHYGAKIVRLLTNSRSSPNLHSGIQSLLVKIVGVLDQFLGQQDDVQTPEDVQNPSPSAVAIDEVNLSGDERDEINQQNISRQITNQPMVKRKNDFDWIRSLHARIYEIEKELAKRKEIFGNEKTVQAIDNQDAPRRDCPKPALSPIQQQQNRFSGPFKEPQSQHKNQQNLSSQSRNAQPTNTGASRDSQKLSPNSNSNKPKSPIAGPSGTSSRPQLTLEQVVQGHRPPGPNTCFNCGTPGHHLLLSVLYKKRTTSERKSPFAEFGSVTPPTNLKTPPVFWETTTEDSYSRTEEISLSDSGSNFTIISERVFARLKPKKLRSAPKHICLKSASGDELQILGQVHLPFRFLDMIKIVPTLVIQNLSLDCICGMDFWRKFQIQPTILQRELLQDPRNVATIDQLTIETILSDDERQKVEEIKRLFLPAKADQLTITPLAEHRIVINEEWKDKPPVRQFPYVMSPKTQELVAIELQRLLNVGIIERSSSDWSLNCVPVIKPTKVRLCLDARKINERTVRDAYPLPHPGRILGQLPKAKYLSTIDLSEAFLQVPLEPNSRKYTAFCVQGKGLFQYTRMPFGLVNSPAILARLMDNVLGHGVLEPYVFVYLDDIVVVTETFEHHVQLLVEIARRLKEANLSINLEKSQFGVSEIPFLGYLLGTDGLRANPEKIRPIVEYERPTSVIKLRRFLGMANYYRRFIQNFSGTTFALTDLLQTKSKVIHWNDDAELAFCEIKERLISAPILGSPDFSREFVIQTDASDVAVAAVLTQQQEHGERVISYYSHKLTTPQKNYHAAEKEALAAILAIDAFRGYIEGYHFTV